MRRLLCGNRIATYVVFCWSVFFGLPSVPPALGSGAEGEIAQEVSSPSPNLFPQSMVERIQGSSSMPLAESADAVLVRPRDWQWNRYVKAALHLPQWLDLGFEHRTRFEVYDHPWRPSQAMGQTDGQIEQRSRVRVGLQGGPFKFLFEGQDSRTHLDDPGDFVNDSIRNEMDILQLMVSATANNFLATGLRADFHFGRLTMDFGRRRLIARNGYRNTTNAFDGMHGQLAKGQDWRVRIFLVEPVLRDDVRLDEQSQRNLFWGVYGETLQMPWMRLNVYYFGLNDQQSPALNQQRTFSTFGLRVYEEPEIGRADYEVETVWQTGKRGSIDHFAHFQHIDLGYTFNLPWSPRVVIHYDYASGDRNAGDSQSSAFDTLFGGRRFEYMPTGNLGPFFRTNISSPGWRVIVEPSKGWKVQLKHRVWYLATSRGAFGISPIVTATNGGVFDATGGSGNFLGHDVELRAQWTVNKNLEFDAGYFHWFKGSYFDRLPASAGLPVGGNIDTDYFYFQTTFRI
ncbi:alginate export family protein [Candidatus Nitronereus thalassa]|uniref:Alginate export family protein n=1 Tax=Candidatus Nitronereus thalassa TaxID=3020898 RepID=A0ABU3K4Z7_9BACT|nr:alginate export family protein [Candidatus Nitronereus thalassa]MDT7041471.1 alginate export family protein [Candidatus Nitronereus thalassa]